MSRVESSLTREPVELDPRRMSPARRARIIARDGGCCRYPGCDETQGLQVDHIIALKLGGRDDDRNLETLCAAHHRQKTDRDIKLISKAKRQGLKDRGEFPPSPTPMRKGRGFQRRWTDQ